MNTIDDQRGKQRSVSAEKNVCCLHIIINPTNPERVTRVVSGAKQTWRQQQNLRHLIGPQ
jgi:hypothetical protein